MPVTPFLSILLIHPERVTAGALGAFSATDLVRAAEQEQVVPQAAAALEHAAPGSAHLDAMRAAAREWALYEAIERRAIRDVIDAAGETRLLFFKGASLAYSAYAAPFERMRRDWDVIVPRAAFDATERLLLRCGFRKAVQAPASVRMRQQSYTRELGGAECTIDLHAELFNPPGMAGRVRFEDLHAAAVPLPGLHPLACGTSEVDALVIACLHRLVHHSSEPRLIWDYDIHMLTRRLAPGFDAVMARAASWGAERLVAAETGRVSSRFDAALPEGARERVRRVAPARDPFARENRSRAGEFLIDWRALGWRDRLSLARDTFLPDPAFVRASSGSALPLPLLYLRRLAKGAASWFRPVRRGNGD
jgi:hypothetical protein